MNNCSHATPIHTRRDFLRTTGAGFGWLAFAALQASLQAADKSRYVSPLAAKPGHHPARAKRVIFMFMNGGPSHLETFDWKPELKKSGPGGHHRLLGPVLDFKASGKSGLMISDAFPNLSRCADDLCLLNGMTTGNPGHQAAVVALHTGSENFVRPSMGAWITYGLGTESADLPGYVTIEPISDLGGAGNYGSAFLPATFQGTRLGFGGRGLPNLDPRTDDSRQRRQIDFIQSLNRRTLARRDPANPELEGAIQSLELAYKMQTSVPGVLDLAGEPAHIRELYGVDDSVTSRFGSQCLMARRLAEKGVRFIQLTSTGWDHHNNLRQGITDRSAAIDKPIAGLIADLKQRDMLKDTLILWGGEFGRGPHDDKGDSNGRGHNNKGFSMWMAGGGVKGGLRHGSTDETGQRAVDGVMDTHDLHATILHLLGLDHEALTYNYAGRDFRLTNVSGKVAEKILL